MTQADAENMITAIAKKMLGLDDSSAAEIAKTLLAKAVIKVGRIHGLRWNSREVEIVLTAGTSKYQIGNTILSDVENITNVQNVWCTDTTGRPIPVLDVDEFNKYARGSTTSGRPELATIHSDDMTMEFYPIPNDSYTLWAYAQLRVTTFDKIPPEYQDVLIDHAIASLDPAQAARLAVEGMKELRADSATKWSGNTIPISRHIGRVGGGTRATSWNLTGE